MAATPDNDKDVELKAQSLADNADERRKRLKQLIVLGEERGYLTYAEINDHLPEDVLDADQIETTTGMIPDRAIQACDEAPAADQLLMSDATPAVADEDAVEEAEAALSTVDSEFGRTTDPVRMYMREMGTVELLTREGEIEIAKRIEDGLKHMIQAISACPGTVAEVLTLIDRIEAGEMRVDELIDGFIDPDAPEEAEAEFAEPDEELLGDDAEEEDEDDDGEAAAALNNANLEELKLQTLERFGEVKALYVRMLKALEKTGSQSKAYLELQEAITAEFMKVRFSVKQVEALCESLRSSVEEIRRFEREIMDICEQKAKMPHARFIDSFPGSESDLTWVEREIAANKPYSATLDRFKYAIIEKQGKLSELQKKAMIPIKELKDINKQMALGESKARMAKREMIEANLRLVISIANPLFFSKE